jgi:hypothetical protein
LKTPDLILSPSKDEAKISCFFSSLLAASSPLRQNPAGSGIRGWIGYYGKFYRTQLRPTLKRIDLYVIPWARRKFNGSSRRSSWFTLPCR